MSSKRQVDVQALLDTHPITPYQMLVCGLCFVIVLLDGFDTAAIGYIASSLIKQFLQPDAPQPRSGERRDSGTVLAH